MDDKKIKNIIDYFFLIGKLKWLKRSGWIERRTPDPESVAEHSFRVAMIALIVAPILKLNREKLVLMALFHDFAGGIVGDLISEGLTKETAIRYIDYNKFEKVDYVEEHKKNEEKFMKKLSRKLDTDEIYQLWKEHSFENSKEATRYSDILFQIGKLANILQALEYQMRGVPEEVLKGFWAAGDVYIKDRFLKKILNNLKKIKNRLKVTV